MIRISTLASSSKGNSAVISTGNTHLLIDTGISALRIRKGLDECGLNIKQIDGIFYTHEHSDHLCGLGVLAKKDVLNIYCSRYLARDLRAIAPTAKLNYIEPGSTIEVGDITVTPIAVSHDAADPLGYLFQHKESKLGYITDTGRITRGMNNLLSGVNALYLESNYDPRMLQESGRPYDIIERISGDWGHLSNEQAAEVVTKVAHENLRHIILGHISPECNTPELALKSMQTTVQELGLATQVCVAPQGNRLNWVEI
ncbi:MAG: MBL fold metallo-hydrolase [Akkermansia sp.]|nr:MBL fold metallo-hydrolase [Akkermansia sp.]